MACSPPEDQSQSECAEKFDASAASIIMDLTCWINRSTEQRRREVQEKSPGRIPRPLNAFLLYQRAYNHGLLARGLKHSGRTISIAAARSWRSASSDIIQTFLTLSHCEKLSHQLAFPDWQFDRRPRFRSKRKYTRTSGVVIPEYIDASDLELVRGASEVNKCVESQAGLDFDLEFMRWDLILQSE